MDFNVLTVVSVAWNFERIASQAKCQFSEHLGIVEEMLAKHCVLAFEDNFGLCNSSVMAQNLGQLPRKKRYELSPGSKP